MRIVMCLYFMFQHATSLLDAALDESAWDLARDLVRFLSAIGQSKVLESRIEFLLKLSTFIS